MSCETVSLDICLQRRPRSDCTSMQSNQGLHCLLTIFAYYRMYEWRAKARMILHIYTGWFESAHFSYVRRHFFLWHDLKVNCTCSCFILYIFFIIFIFFPAEQECVCFFFTWMTVKRVVPTDLLLPVTEMNTGTDLRQQQPSGETSNNGLEVCYFFNWQSFMNVRLKPKHQIKLIYT